jgi:hypothetical protein
LIAAARWHSCIDPASSKQAITSSLHPAARATTSIDRSIHAPAHSAMPQYLVKLVHNTLDNFRYPELDACLDFFLGPDAAQGAYDTCVRALCVWGEG